MDTKLTLKLEHHVIERAKIYAKNHKISLSKLFENYLLNILNENSTEKPLEEITPLVKSLSGIIKLSDDYNHKND